MEYREVIAECIKERGISKAQLARELEMSPQLLNSKINRSKVMTTDAVIKIFNALGYDIVVKNRETGEEIVFTVCGTQE